jgi:uncharacterized protein
MKDAIPNTDDPRYVDIHVHADACRDRGFTLDKLAEWMDANGVARCIVQQLEQTLPRTAEARETQKRNFRTYQGRIYEFCVIFPDDVASKAEAVVRLKRWQAEGAIGFGEHYGAGLNVDDPKNMRLYAACGEVGLPILFHMDGENNRDEVGLPHLENALKANPDCNFIAHAPGWWGNLANGSCDRLLQAYPNLYGDLSAGSGARAIGRDRVAGREFLIRNASKLMFGTDIGPWSLGKPPAPQFALLAELDLPHDVEDRIYRKNAEKLFGF